MKRSSSPHGILNISDHWTSWKWIESDQQSSTSEWTINLVSFGSQYMKRSTFELGLTAPKLNLWLDIAEGEGHIWEQRSEECLQEIFKKIQDKINGVCFNVLWRVLSLLFTFNLSLTLYLATTDYQWTPYTTMVSHRVVEIHAYTLLCQTIAKIWWSHLRWLLRVLIHQETKHPQWFAKVNLN